MPAPPPLSEVAIVSALETRSATPFAGMTRIRFDGCDLSPGRGTPVGEAYPSTLEHSRHRLAAPGRRARPPLGGAGPRCAHRPRPARARLPGARRNRGGVALPPP